MLLNKYKKIFRFKNNTISISLSFYFCTFFLEFSYFLSLFFRVYCDLFQFQIIFNFFYKFHFFCIVNLYHFCFYIFFYEILFIFYYSDLIIPIKKKTGAFIPVLCYQPYFLIIQFNSLNLIYF